MKRELFNNWIESLRSGKYKQGVLYLKRDNKYCCLGVLCEIAGLQYDEINKMFVYNGDKNPSYLPESFAIEIGMNYRGININNIFSSDKSLSCMDDTGKTFEQIADILEQNPLNYIESLED